MLVFDRSHSRILMRSYVRDVGASFGNGPLSSRASVFCKDEENGVTAFDYAAIRGIVHSKRKGTTGLQ